MRKHRTPVVGALALLVTVFTPGLAQEPEYVVLTTFEVAPIEAPAFEEAVQTFVRAAEQAELPQQFGWLTYQANNRYHIVGFRQSMASFDDPGAIMEAFAGTPGEPTVGEALGMIQQLHYMSTTNVSRYMEEWSYRPTSPAATEEDHAGVAIFEAWIQPGHEEELDANSKELVSLLEGIGTPYPAYGHQTVVGDGGYVWYVVFYDDLSSFYGENAFANFLEGSGHEEHAAEVFGARSQMTLRADNHTAVRRPDLTYMPDM